MLKLLCLLLWKNYHIVTHSWRLFCVCFLCEIAWFSLIHMSIWPVQQSAGHSTISLELESISIRPIHIFYSPSTAFTDSIINGTAKGAMQDSVKIHSFNSFQKMYKAIYSQTSKGYFVGINFTHSENISNDIPKTLSYVIWEVFNVSRSFHINRRTVKQRYEVSDCQNTMCIQGAIDKSFIDQVVKDNTYKFFGLSLPYSLSDRCLQDPLNDLHCIMIQRNAALSLLSFFIVRCVSRESAAGGEKLMKIAGVPSWSKWSSWLITSFVLELIPCLVISIILYMLFYDTHIFFTPVYFLITMYCLASKSSYFFIMSIIRHQYIAQIACFLFWLLSHLPLLIRKEDFLHKFVTSLLPQMAVIWGYDELEEMNKSSKCSGKVKIVDNWSLTIAIFFLIVECMIYTLLAWLADVLLHGTFKREFPMRQRRQSMMLPPESFNVLKSQRISFEQFYLSEESVAIAIRDLTHRYKRYAWGNIRSNLTLTGISMDIYKNEITFVLGSSKAGMSTFISIIIGDMSPTSGSVTVDGLNPRVSWKIGLQIGICLQQPHFFFNLSPKENLMFFSMFRGNSRKTASAQADVIMQMLNIRNTTVERSEANLKKMCIGMALIGTPSIVVLDEPTTGLDADAREDVWRALNLMRRKHTILITTKDTEEADNMADRIAILHQGCMQMYGTNLWLKREFGSDYYLSLNRLYGNNTEAISKLVQEYVPEAKIVKNYDVLLTFSIPYERREDANILIKALEEKEADLGLFNIYINGSTLKDIYHKVFPAFTYPLTKTSLTSTRVKGELSKENIIRNQLEALIRKKFLFSYRFLVKNRFLGLLTFMAHASGFIIFSKHVHVFNTNEFNLTQYKDIRGGYYIEGNVPQSLLESYRNALAKITHTFKQVFEQTVMMDMPIAAEIIEDQGMLVMKALYGPWVGEMCWKSVNTMTNAALQSAEPQFSIIMEKQVLDIYLIHDKVLDAILFSCLGFVLILAYFPLLPMKEIVNKTKRMQYLAGVTNVMYWSVCFVFDFILYTAFSCGAAVLIGVVNYENIVIGDLLAVFLLFLIFGLCAIPLTYLHTFVFKSYVQVMMCILMQVSICIIIHLSLFQNKYAAVMEMLNFYPFFGILSATLHLYMQMSENMCVRMRTKVDCNKNDDRCCIYPCLHANCFIVKPYLVFSSPQNPHGIANQLLSLSIGTFAMSFLLLMTDSKMLQRFLHHVTQKVFYKEEHEIIQEDSEVRAEKEFVHALSSQPYDNEYLLAVDNLTRNYKQSNCSFNYFSAVDSVSMAIRKGDYFGLLGCNDAGKTLLAGMIVGDVIPSSGNVRLFCKSIGYCPQDVQLLTTFTAYENLIFFATIRGLSKERGFYEVDKILKYFGLWESRNVYFHDYNRTEMIKLGIAVAMIGDPEIIIIDTVTQEVDPLTRWQIWKTVLKLQKPWQGILVTSHLLEESEEIYTKFAGMKNGKLVCIGNWKQLRAKYDLRLYLRIFINVNSGNQVQQSLLREAVESMFNNMLRLKVQTNSWLLYTLVDRTVKVTTLVNGMVQLQKQFVEIEDFSIEKPNICELFRIIEADSDIRL